MKVLKINYAILLLAVTVIALAVYTVIRFQSLPY